MDMTGVRLTELVEAAGCAAKIAPGALAKVLGNLPRTEDPNLLVGFDASDDACVYDLGDGRGLVQTCDFFPPMVDDPFLFGQVAAANALSDVYAMGGEPKLALNLLCFPNCLGIEVAGQILAGGADWGPYVQVVLGLMLVILAVVLAIEGVTTIAKQKKAAKA